MLLPFFIGIFFSNFFFKHQIVNVHFQIDITALDIQSPLVDHIARVTVFPRQRLPPEVPTRVKCLSFNELSADAHKLSQPWVLLRSTDENTVVGKVDDLGDDGLKVVVDVEFNAAVYWQDILNAIDNYCAFHHPIHVHVAMCTFHHPIAIILMNRWAHR